MDKWEVMQARHSVRRYQDRPIEPALAARLQEAVQQVNEQSGLRFALCCNEPEAFAADKPHYGAFAGCRNYLLLAGKKGADEAVGYWGEKLVLLAQEWGLNTCWVALTYKKRKVAPTLAEDEQIYLVIALGYGETEGVPHRSKPLEKLSNITPDAPQWFVDGVQAAALAPTAINQQKFYFRLCENNRVQAVCGKLAPYGKVDLGIAKYHFEWGAGKENFEWVTLS